MNIIYLVKTWRFYVIYHIPEDSGVFHGVLIDLNGGQKLVQVLHVTLMLLSPTASL